MTQVPFWAKAIGVFSLGCLLGGLLGFSWMQLPAESKVCLIYGRGSRMPTCLMLKGAFSPKEWAD